MAIMVFVCRNDFQERLMWSGWILMSGDALRDICYGRLKRIQTDLVNWQTQKRILISSSYGICCLHIRENERRRRWSWNDVMSNHCVFILLGNLTGIMNFVDWLRWSRVGGLQSNECSFANAHFHFCSSHPDRASSTVCCKQKCPGKAGVIHLIGGEGGIRTPVGVTLNGFRDRHNQPLCHLSGRTADQ